MVKVAHLIYRIELYGALFKLIIEEIVVGKESLARTKGMHDSDDEVLFLFGTCFGHGELS